MRLHRWIYFAFALVNLIDLAFSVVIGERFTGQIAIFTNVGAVVVNILIVAVVVIVYLPNANQPGTGATGNIAQHPAFCGIASVIADTDNNCAFFNPTGAALLPTVTLASIWYSNEFLQFICLAIIYIGLGTAKALLNFLSSGSTKLITQGVQEARQGMESLQNGLSQAITTDLPLKVKSLPRFVAAKLDFFTFYTQDQIKWYFKMQFPHWVAVGFTCAWFAWFQQNVKTVNYVFTLFSTPVVHSRLTREFQWGNFIFYAMVGLINISAFLLCMFMLNFRKHRRSVWGSAIGFIGNLLLFVVLICVYRIPANNDGTGGWNIANDRQRFCATQIASPFYQYFSNAANRCPNTTACSTMYEPSELDLDSDFKALLVFVITNCICYFALLIYNLKILQQIKLYEYSEQQLSLVEQQYIMDEIDSLTYTGSEDSYESYKYNRNSGMDPNSSLFMDPGFQGQFQQGQFQQQQQFQGYPQQFQGYPQQFQGYPQQQPMYPQQFQGQQPYQPVQFMQQQPQQFSSAPQYMPVDQTDGDANHEKHETKPKHLNKHQVPKKSQKI